MKLWEFGGTGITTMAAAKGSGLEEEAPEMITVQQPQMKVE